MTVLARIERDGMLEWAISDDLKSWSSLGSANEAPETLQEAILACQRKLNWDPVTPMFAVSEEQLRAPVERPGKIVGVAANFRQHAVEVGLRSTPELRIFAKFASSVTGPYSVVRAHRGVTNQVDYEAELAVVVGRHLPQGVHVENAMDYVFGYAVANDISARDIQTLSGQLTQAKSLDTFLPIGPWITLRSPDEVPIGMRTITSTVNGERRQHALGDEMVRDVPTLILEVGRLMSLHPGDVLITGSPGGSGIGMNPPTFLADGDVVACEISGLGTLRNPIRILDGEQ